MSGAALNVPSGLSIRSRKAALLEQLAREQHSDVRKKWAASVTSNTALEQSCLEYVESFRRQFVQLFPDRAPLLLAVPNESNVEKVVCTFIRPTSLPDMSAYSVQQCASFVSDFLEYLPLAEPTQVPQLLLSPAALCSLRAGDCFDLSHFLVSLLRGYGVDAYVVSGYACNWATKADRSRLQSPELVEELGAAAAAEQKKKSKAEEQEQQEQAEEEHRENKYKVTQPLSRKSKFLTMKEARAREEAKKTSDWEADEAPAEEPSLLPEADTVESLREEEAKTDRLFGHRVHSWVMVLPTKSRDDVVEPMFIEPSTGLMYSTADVSPFLGIESVWNEKNYWVNLQTNESLAETSFELDNEANWEFVFIDESKERLELQRSLEEAADGEHEAVEQAAGDQLLDGAQTTLEVLSVPQAWCGPVRIDRTAMADRYPGGTKYVHYHSCEVVLYSDFHSASDGLSRRVIVFDGDDMSEKRAVFERFSHRADRMWKRQEFLTQDPPRVHEFFLPGLPSDLREFVNVEGVTREWHFYPHTRVDGLVLRKELIGVKIMEFYEGRTDRLVYRSVAPEDDAVGGRWPLRLNLAGHGEDDEDFNIRKVTEKYARNPAVEAGRDVRKRTHFVGENMIRLDYHYEQGRITASREVYYMPPESRVVESRVEQDWKPMSALEQAERLIALKETEKVLNGALRDREREFRELLTSMNRDTRDRAGLARTVYDLVRSKADEEEEEEDEEEVAEDGKKKKKKRKKKRRKEEEEEVDELSPFLADFPPKKELNRKEALLVKHECLNALKERLLERANIINEHLEREQKALKAEQQRINRLQGDQEAEEEYTRFYEETTFRIAILKARKARHEEKAIQAYRQLDLKLDMHPRLRVLAGKE